MIADTQPRTRAQGVGATDGLYPFHHRSVADVDMLPEDLRKPIAQSANVHSVGVD